MAVSFAWFLVVRAEVFKEAPTFFEILEARNELADVDDVPAADAEGAADAARDRLTTAAGPPMRLYVATQGGHAVWLVVYDGDENDEKATVSKVH